MRMFILVALIFQGCSPAAEEAEATSNQQAIPAPTPVRAGEDVVAAYRMNAPDGSRIGTMTVEASASGAARLEMRVANGSAPSQVGWVTESGEVIMTAATPEGPKLIRASDMAAVAQEQMTRFLPDESARNPFGDMRLEAIGPETVNGRSGTRYVVRAADEQTNSGERGMDFVVAEDPTLALIGRATSHTLAGPSAVTGSATPRAFLQLQQRLRSGAALRAGRVMILESVENRPIDQSRLTVQGTPITRDELRQIMQRAIPPEMTRNIPR